MTIDEHNNSIGPSAVIDLNADVGEFFEGENSSHDEKVIKRASSVNIACGFHAGDPQVMQRSVDCAVKNKVAIGALPGLPDLLGMGQQIQKISPKKAYAQVLYQVGALQAFAAAAGTRVVHVKPHGALYTMAARDAELARAIATAVADLDSNLILVGLAGSELITAGQAVGLPVAREAFADRAYNKDGSLVSRDNEGAEVEDVEECVQRSLRMIKEQKVTAITGEEIEVIADTLCIDADNPYAVMLLDELRRAFHKESIDINSLSEIVSVSK